MKSKQMLLIAIAIIGIISAIAFYFYHKRNYIKLRTVLVEYPLPKIECKYSRQIYPKYRIEITYLPFAPNIGDRLNDLKNAGLINARQVQSALRQAALLTDPGWLYNG